MATRWFEKSPPAMWHLERSGGQKAAAGAVLFSGLSPWGSVDHGPLEVLHRVHTRVYGGLLHLFPTQVISPCRPPSTFVNIHLGPVYPWTFFTDLPHSEGNKVSLPVVYCLSKSEDALPLSELPTAKETCELLLRHDSYLLPWHIISATLSLMHRRTGRSKWHCAALHLILGQEAGYAHSAQPTAIAGLSSFHSFQGYLLPHPSCTGERGQCPFHLGVHQALPLHKAQGLLHLNNPELSIATWCTPGQQVRLSSTLKVIVLEIGSQIHWPIHNLQSHQICTSHSTQGSIFYKPVKDSLPQATFQSPFCSAVMDS